MSEIWVQLFLVIVLVVINGAFGIAERTLDEIMVAPR
jgi:hypothetical protein